MNKLKEIRTKYKISQAELARRLDTTQGQVCRLEISTRQLTENWLERLSKALGCTKAELLGEIPAFTAEELAMLEVFRQIETSEKRAALYNLAQTMIAPAAASPSDEKDKNAG